jgi:hypothetical protein
MQLVVTCLVLGIVAWQNYRSFERFRDIGNQVALPENHPFYLFLQEQKTLFNSYLYIAFAVGIVLSVVLTLFLSHRLAGPLVRMKSYLDEAIALKKIPKYPIKFRKGDFFNDIPEKLNEALRVARTDGQNDHKKENKSA